MIVYDAMKFRRLVRQADQLSAATREISERRQAARQALNELTSQLEEFERAGHGKTRSVHARNPNTGRDMTIDVQDDKTPLARLRADIEKVRRELDEITQEYTEAGARSAQAKQLVANCRDFLQQHGAKVDA